jgi:hypothetical protein
MLTDTVNYALNNQTGMFTVNVVIRNTTANAYPGGDRLTITFPGTDFLVQGATTPGTHWYDHNRFSCASVACGTNNANMMCLTYTAAQMQTLVNSGQYIYDPTNPCFVIPNSNISTPGGTPGIVVASLPPISAGGSTTVSVGPLYDSSRNPSVSVQLKCN